MAALMILALIAAVLPAYAQEVTVVDGETQQPIAGVLIASAVHAAVTRESGTAPLDGFSENDSLTFTHLTYHTTVVHYREAAASAVQLYPKTIEQPEALVTADRTGDNASVPAQRYSLAASDAARFSTIGDFLSRSTALQVKDYGGAGGLKTVSVRGLSSNTTIVLFNGVRVNDLRSGAFDFSAVSAAETGRIEVVRGSDVETGTASAGGVVKLISRTPAESSPLAAAVKYDSFGGESFSLNASAAGRALSGSIELERSYSANRFAFRFDEEEYERENAFYSRSRASASLYWTGGGPVVRLYTRASAFTNGIPGFVVTGNLSSSRAFSESDEFLAVADAQYELGNGFDAELSTGAHLQLLALTDPDGKLLFITDHQRSHMRDVTAALRLRKQFAVLTFHTGYEFGYGSIDNIGEYLSSDSAPSDLSRQYHALTAGLSEAVFSVDNIARVTMQGGTRLEFLNEEAVAEMQSSTASVFARIAAQPDGFPSLKFTAGYERNHRNPTFNERYYSGILSSELLRRESYTGFDAGAQLRFDLAGETAFQVNLYHITGADKIIWVPTRQALQTPRNIGRVVSTGLEAAAEKALFGEALQLRLLYTLTEARNETRLPGNDNTFRKQLVYTPRHRINGSVALHFLDFDILFSGSWSGESFMTADNDPRHALDGYFVADLSAGWQLRSSWSAHTFRVSVLNLFNEDYLVIQSYPMPLRSFTLYYRMEIL